MKTLLLALLVLVPACGDDNATPAGPSPEAALALLKADTAAFWARSEHQDAELTIQHCLVGVKGHGTKAERTAAEAEALAAEIYARAKAGEDFDLLVKNHSDDIYPCLYSMTLGPEASPGVYLRDQVAPPALGATAWRLAVDEIGIVPFDGEAADPKSPYGWHLVKRLK